MRRRAARCRLPSNPQPLLPKPSVLTFNPQDFNAEVLEAVTCPNVDTNLRAHLTTAPAPSHRYFSGDFASVGEHLASEEGLLFDAVLTSESIYNPKSAAQLLAATKACMRRGGTLWVAAKSHYFGVGGGLAAFKAQVAADGVFGVDVAWSFDDGASNMREVLALTFTKDSNV